MAEVPYRWRVPYVVVSGTVHSKLKDLVVAPSVRKRNYLNWFFFILSFLYPLLFRYYYNRWDIFGQTAYCFGFVTKILSIIISFFWSLIFPPLPFMIFSAPFSISFPFSFSVSLKKSSLLSPSLLLLLSYRLIGSLASRQLLPGQPGVLHTEVYQSCARYVRTFLYVVLPVDQVRVASTQESL